MPDYPIGPQPPLVDGRLTAFQTALLSGGIILFLVLLYEMRDFLNPPLVATAGIMMFWPLRKFHTVRAILFTGGFLLIMWFLDELSTILLPFATVYLFAYLFDPLVTKARERFGLPRWASALAITLLLVGVFSLIIFLLVPSLVSQFEVLARRGLDVFGNFRIWLRTTTLFDRLEEAGVVNKEQIVTQLTDFVNTQASALAGSIPNAIQGLLSSINTLLGIITILTIMPVVHFYTLKDYPAIKDRLVELFPTFGGRRDYLVKAGGIVGNYVRGQLAISAIAAFNVSLVLIILDVPFALLIGILGGILNMIPNFGIIITNVIGVLIGLIFGDPWYWDVLKILLTLLGQSLLEQTILSPNILSHQVGLHPVLIILALFVFGYFMGWFGLLIAVPVTALIMTFFKSYRAQMSLELGRGVDASMEP